MKKLIALALMTALLALALTACADMLSGSSTATRPPAATDAPAETTAEPAQSPAATTEPAAEATEAPAN